MFGSAPSRGNIAKAPLYLQNSEGRIGSVDFNSSEAFVVKGSQNPPGAPTAALAGSGAGNLTPGSYYYRVTFVTASGETDGGSVSAVVTTTLGDGKVDLSDIPVGSTGIVTARKLYRTKKNQPPEAANFFLLATVSDNSTTTYADNLNDISLGAACPTENSTLDQLFAVSAAGAQTIAGLTSGRVPYVSTGGLLKDEAAFAYNESTNTLTSDKMSLSSAGSVSAPTLRFAGSGTDLGFYSSGNAVIFAQSSTQMVGLSADNGHLSLRSTWSLSWSSGSDVINAGDLKLFRDAASTLAQRNGSNEQVFNIYGTYTDADNYERLSISGGPASGEGILIRSQAAGTGTVRAIKFYVGADRVASVSAEGYNLDSSASLRWSTDENPDGAKDIQLDRSGAKVLDVTSDGATFDVTVRVGTVDFQGADAAGAEVGTLTNAPTAGNPAVFIPVKFNGSVYKIPAWS